MDFYEMVDNLLLGYSNINIHRTLARVDIPNQEYSDFMGLLIHIGAMEGSDGIRVALLHILLRQGELNPDFLEKLMDDADELEDIEIN